MHLLYLYLQVTTQLHGLALEAGDQLLAEEEQAAAQAAAKKTKKLRQKAKKQQQQQQQQQQNGQPAAEAEDEAEEEAASPASGHMSPQRQAVSVGALSSKDHPFSSVQLLSLGTQVLPDSPRHSADISHHQAGVSTPQHNAACAQSAPISSQQLSPVSTTPLASRQEGAVPQPAGLLDEQSGSAQPEVAPEEKTSLSPASEEHAADNSVLQLLLCCPLTKVSPRCHALMHTHACCLRF